MDSYLIFLIGAIEVGAYEVFCLIIDVQATSEIVAEVELINSAQREGEAIFILFIEAFCLLFWEYE